MHIIYRSLFLIQFICCISKQNLNIYNEVNEKVTNSLVLNNNLNNLLINKDEKLSQNSWESKKENTSNNKSSLKIKNIKKAKIGLIKSVIYSKTTREISNLEDKYKSSADKNNSKKSYLKPIKNDKNPYETQYFNKTISPKNNFKNKLKFNLSSNQLKILAYFFINIPIIGLFIWVILMMKEEINCKNRWENINNNYALKKYQDCEDAYFRNILLCILFMFIMCISFSLCPIKLVFSNIKRFLCKCKTNKRETKFRIENEKIKNNEDI